MIQEEIFELDKKIKQITGILDRRKQKASEWNPNYKKILQEKHDKNAYLQKKCPSKIELDQRRSIHDENTKQYLQKRCAESRGKIQTFYNQLKELDILQKKKNKIRLLNDKQNMKVQNKASKLSLQPRQKNQKIGNNEIQQTEQCSRTLKDRSNPFAGCKVDKFIEFFQQNKNNDEQMGLKIVRHFGVGVENTPIGPMLKKEQKKRDEQKNKKNPLKLNCSIRSTSYGKKFTSSFKQKESWFRQSAQKNMFEDRIKKIIKYHGQFWNQEFDIKQ